MGFFKKLGKGLKKNISFKNLVKVVGKAATFVPVVGDMAGGIIEGAQAAHYAKKEQRQAEAEAAAMMNQQPKGIINTMEAKNNPTFMDILQGAGGGALTGAGQVLAGSSTAGTAGATLVDSTLSEWFKKNWMKVVVGAGALFGLIFFAIRSGNGRKRR